MESIDTLLRKLAAALLLLALPLTAAHAQDDGCTRRWGLHASAGTLTQTEDGGPADSRENDGYAFALTADWFVTQRLAITAGLYAERTGMLSHLDADGIGPKSFWMGGVQAGGKYYFFPRRWIFQPYVGASVYANVLNLGHSRGSFDFRANDSYAHRCHADYDTHCPALSLAPQAGVDLRLLGSVSLTFAADFRWGLYGRNSVTLRHADGPEGGSTELLANPMSRTVLSLGLRIDFPTRPVNWRRAGCTLLDLIYIWINGRT